eukprot:scaffold55264_cov52-Phaeocystis_antarctica.AAC.3
MLGDMPTTRGRRVLVQKARSGGRALKQERVPELRFGDISVVRATKRVMTNLRVHHSPLVANIVEGHHEGALHAACGRSRVPGVMTTTLRVNAQERR